MSFSPKRETHELQASGVKRAVHHLQTSSKGREAREAFELLAEKLNITSLRAQK